MNTYNYALELMINPIKFYSKNYILAKNEKLSDAEKKYPDREIISWKEMQEIIKIKNEFVEQKRGYI
jgi:hypothetical protein